MRLQFVVRPITRKTWFWLFLAGLSVSLSAVGFIAGAAPPPPTLPTVYFDQTLPTPDVPSEVLIGEQFTFKVRFKQPLGSTTIGFGPFIDLVLDTGGADIKKSCPRCDGIRFVKAEMVSVNGGPVALHSSLPLFAPCTPTPVTVPLGPHSFASSGILPILTVPAGAQLVTIELPFGSFTPAQPEIVVEVTAIVDAFADDNVPVKISARGGFRFGKDALDNFSADPPILSDENPPGTQVTDSSLWNAQAQTTPRVMIIKKDYAGREDETATGPNFPHTYTIKVDIANGQSIANLTVQDSLPNNMQYVGQVAVSIHGAPATPGSTCVGVDYVLTQQPTTPGGTLVVSFCNPIIGALPLPPDDVTVAFTFFIPDLDANLNPVLSPNCTPALSINGIHAEGDWTQTPQDLLCDQSPLHVINNVTSAHTLHDKCMAIQKSVSMFNDTGATGPTPGDTLRYELNFQISDYKTVRSIQIRDILSDGQRLLGPPLGPPPTLTVADKFKPGGATGNFILGPAMSVQLNNPTVPCEGVTGGTVITFRVSIRMTTLPLPPPRWSLGILTGGWASSLNKNIPATGKIVFYAKIQDQFGVVHPTGDKWVDKDDPLTNCVNTFRGTILNNVNPPFIPFLPVAIAQDDSKTITAIVTDVIKKTVYAVKRGGSFICGPSGPPCSNLPNPPEEVRPGDEVTFRIEKTIPSSDAEQLTVQDWPPLPVFDVNDPNANGTPPNWPSTATAICSPISLPVPGQACRRVSHSLPVTPTLSAVNNSLTFGYGTFFATNNLPKTIDLLFTITVTNQPFADGLFLTNEAQECENNTFGVTFCQAAIAQVNMREPKLSITKGVVATDNPNGVFNPLLNPSGIWKPFGTSCPRFNPIINSANLGGLINSNLSNVDANDSVTFAIAIENTGGAPAYEIELADIIPLGPVDELTCFSPNSGFCVQRGNGFAVPFTTAIGGHGRTIIKLPGVSLDPLNSTTAGTGTNILIITFNAQLISDIKPGCCSNRAELLHYASQPGGPDFVSAGFTPPFSDIATICVGPKALAKCIVQTSEPHTAPQNSASGTPQVAIGEIIRYRLTASVPEGVSPNFQVKDILPLGLTYLGNPRVRFVSTNPASFTSSTLSGAGLNFSGDETTVTVKCAPLSAPTLTFSLPLGAVTVLAGSGGDVTFSLGTLTNVESDTNLELVIIEFNALVNNIPSNINGTVLTNKFEFIVDGQPFDQNNAISANAVVVEPKLLLNKSVTPIDAAGLNTCTVTVTNTGTSDAFDVHMTDTLPTGLLLGSAPTVSVAPPGCAAPTLNVSTVSGITTITVDVPRIPVSPSCVVTLSFKIRANSQCFTNTAQGTYTSLPGNNPVGTQANPTGSVTPCLPINISHDDCERVYNVSSQATINAGCPPCAAQPSNMVSWWPLNEQAGATVVTDIKGGHNGTPLPGGSIGLGNAQPGKVGGALYIVNNNVSVPDHPSLRLGTSNLTIDAWLGSQNPQQVHGIVDKLDIVSKRGYALYIENRFVRFVMANGTSFTTYTSTAQLNIVNTALSWHHVAVTVDRVNGVGTFYINGSAGVGTFVPLASSTNISTTSALLIGGSRLTFSTCVCEYLLDEIEIFNAVLPAIDIKQIFAAGATGKCP